MLLRRRLVAALAVTSTTVVTTALGSGATGAHAAPSQQPTPEITVTALHGPDGEQLQEARAINERGQIATLTNRDSSNLGDLFVWQRGRTTRVTPEGVHGWPADISERGQVVGGTRDLPFSWSRGEWRALPIGDDSEEAYGGAVNDRGQVLVRENLGGYPARDFVMAVWQGDRVTRTPVYNDVEWATAIGLNERGQAVYNVTHTTTNNITKSAFHWQVGGEITDLGNLGQPWTHATDINNRGQIVGASSLTTADGNNETHPFLWEDGEMTDLGTLGGSTSTADDINNQGQIVGRSITGDGDRFRQHGFLWEDGQMTDLYALIDQPLYSTLEEHLLDINDRGQIAGTVPLDIFGRAFLWTVH